VFVLKSCGGRDWRNNVTGVFGSTFSNKGGGSASREKGGGEGT